jgi:hypothetical protein
MSAIMKQLGMERKNIQKTIKCACNALKADPENEEAKACLKLARAKKKLVKHLEIRHLGL